MFYKLTLYTSTVILNVQKNSKSLENLHNCKLIFQLSRSSKPIMYKYSIVSQICRDFERTDEIRHIRRLEENWLHLNFIGKSR